MRLLMLFIAGCSSVYTGVVVSKNEYTQTARVKVNQGHYIWINVDTDLIEVGDTIKVDNKNFKMIQ